MKRKLQLLQVIFLLLMGLHINVWAQDSTQQKAALYTKTINERSDKIVAKLGINNTTVYEAVKEIIAKQYRDLNSIYTLRDSNISIAKAAFVGNKLALDSVSKIETAKVDQQLSILHPSYLGSLKTHLTPQQIEQVKDGMTYNVLNVTYKGYQDMIPTLTEPQKAQIYDWLVEAREHAIDAESSDKKHAWFGKYKGRINNYLSAQGYDSQKERTEWEKRIKAAAAAKSKTASSSTQ